MRNTIACIILLAGVAMPAFAQPSIEITPTIGYVFGGSFDELIAPGLGNASVNIDDSESYGLIFDIGNDRNAFEFTWMHQSTDLSTNSEAFPLFDYASDNFQFGYLYYFSDGATKPFMNFSLGWTDFDIDGQDGDSRFSGAIGAGVSHYFNDRFGLRFQARWIPTYVNTDEAYIVCDPFGYCWAVGDDNYLYQTEVSLGLIIKIR